MRKAATFGTRGLSQEQLQARAIRNPYVDITKGRTGLNDVLPVSHKDESLRTFMLTMYNYMFMGLGITGVVAFLTYMLTITTDPSLAFSDEGGVYQITDTEHLNGLGVLLWATPISYLVCFGPLALLILTCSMWRDMEPGAALAVFIGVATLIGVSFSGLALTYTNGSIAQMFFATAAGFGSLSLFGYTTKRDISGWSSFLWMGLFGVIAALIINWFTQSDMMEFVISVAGIIVFSGFTAYDTQMIKDAYSNRLDERTAKKLAITGALDLYLDFVNLFRFLLALLGQEE